MLQKSKNNMEPQDADLEKFKEKDLVKSTRLITLNFIKLK